MMKGRTFCLIFLILIFMTLIIPCLGAAPKKGGNKGAKGSAKQQPAAPVNKQREKDKQAKKEIKDLVSGYVKKTQDLVFGPINNPTTLIAMFVFSASIVSLFMLGSFLFKWMNGVFAITLFVCFGLWLYHHLEESAVRVLWEWYKIQNATGVKVEL